MAVTIALNFQIYQVYWYMYIIVCDYAHVYKGLDKTSAVFAESARGNYHKAQRTNTSCCQVPDGSWRV